MLAALDSGHADDAQDRKRAATAPSPPAASEPPSLLDHPTQLALVVSPGLGLDRESDAGRRDRDRIDVPTVLPT
jgi:hypothetical protein